MKASWQETIIAACSVLPRPKMLNCANAMLDCSQKEGEHNTRKLQRSRAGLIIYEAYIIL